MVIQEVVSIPPAARKPNRQASPASHQESRLPRRRCRDGVQAHLYGLDARGLRPVHEWAGGFERFWNESFDRLEEYVQDLKQARQEE
jgi:hypothetical protein